MVIRAGEMAELLQLREMAEQMGLQGQELWRLSENSKKSAEKKGDSNENINVKKLLDNMKKPRSCSATGA